MWQILEHRKVDRKLAKAKVPLEVLKRYEKWKDIARLTGPQGLERIKVIDINPHDYAKK